MVDRVQIPAALGSVEWLPLFSAPVQGEKESAEIFKLRTQLYEKTQCHVLLGVRYADPETVDELTFKLREIALQEKARVRELRAVQSEETFPALHQSGFRTREHAVAIRELGREILAAMLGGIRNLDVGRSEPKAVEAMTLDEQIKILEFLRWSELAATVVLGRQNPTLLELLPSGP